MRGVEPPTTRLQGGASTVNVTPAQSGEGGPIRTGIKRFWSPLFYQLNYTPLTKKRGQPPSMADKISIVLPFVKGRCNNKYNLFREQDPYR